MDLSKYIRDIPDFPKPGILFRDITPLLQSSEAFHYVVKKLTDMAEARGAEVIVGIESRGFIFGAPVALALNVPFVPIRKPGKLPAVRMSVEYSLEYGSGQLDIHKDALKSGQKVCIIDDLLATGGTARAGAKLVELLEAKVVLQLFVIELLGLKGRDHLKEYAIEALLQY